jgi:hypothetical protein
MTIDISEDQKLFSAATIFFKADSSRERRSVSACPSSHSRENWHGWADGTSATDQHGPPSRDSTGSSPKARRMSVDGTTFQSDVFSHREESIVPQHPRSPRLSTASSSSISSVSSTLSLQNRDYNRPRSPDRTGRASLRNACTSHWSSLSVKRPSDCRACEHSATAGLTSNSLIDQPHACIVSGRWYYGELDTEYPCPSLHAQTTTTLFSSCLPTPNQFLGYTLGARCPRASTKHRSFAFFRSFHRRTQSRSHELAVECCVNMVCAQRWGAEAA